MSNHPVSCCGSTGKLHGDVGGTCPGAHRIDAAWHTGIVLLTLFGLVTIPAAQASAPSDTSRIAPKRWIFLSERPGPAPPSSRDRWTRPVAPSFLDRLRETGVEPLRRSRWFHAVSARLTQAAQRRVEALPFVRSVRPVRGTSHPTTNGDRAATLPGPLGLRRAADSLQYGYAREHLARINALAPLERGLNGHGIRIGFLDAHFRGLRHPAFASLRRDGRLGGLRNFTAHRQGGNHGAAVVSLAAGWAPGSLIGPAYGATVFGATTEFTQFERNVEEDNFVAGLEWLQRQGVDVVNVSVGYTTFDEGQHSYTTDDLDGDTALTTRAVDRAAQLGVTVVVSAGNSGCANPDSCWYYVNTPADADSAITVGAAMPDSSLVPFSSRGPTADGRRKPDVLVQGQDVVAAWDDSRYVAMGGTSFASPQVTAIVAQMLQVNPTLTPIQVRQILRSTASQAHAPDSMHGWGIVNANAAVRTAEWRARQAPPSTLSVDAPYRRTDTDQLTVPLTAPSGVSSLTLSIYTPSGRRVRSVERVAHPGPNRIDVPVSEIPPGVYRYRIVTNTNLGASGDMTLVEYPR